MNVPTKTLIIGVVLAAVALPASASATPAVTCGQVVTADLTLKQDLDCSAGGNGGLVVGADDITIDLDGHTITGAGALDGYEGIENEGYDHVTIKNGTIERFKDALFFSNVAKNRVSGLSLKSGSPGTSNGLYSSYGTGNKIVNNRFFNLNHAIELINGSENKIARNRLIQADRGVFTTNEAFDKISDNVSSGFSISTYAYYSQGDFRSTYENDVANGGYEGFYVNQPRGVAISGAEANDNGYAGIYIDGVTTGGYTAKVTGSEANNNAEYGIYAAYGINSWNNSATGNEYYNCHLVACNG